MLFAIDGGKPYLIANGKRLPVSISGGVVTIDTAHAEKTADCGRYSLREIVAKLGDDVSSIPGAKKRTAKKD